MSEKRNPVDRPPQRQPKSQALVKKPKIYTLLADTISLLRQYKYLPDTMQIQYNQGLSP